MANSVQFLLHPQIGKELPSLFIAADNKKHFDRTEILMIAGSCQCTGLGFNKRNALALACPGFVGLPHITPYSLEGTQAAAGSRVTPSPGSGV
jgi:hypothetical protein